MNIEHSVMRCIHGYARVVGLTSFANSGRDLLSSDMRREKYGPPGRSYDEYATARRLWK
jgi:hypothetical protein